MGCLVRDKGQWTLSLFKAPGAFHLVKISGIFGSAVNGTRFVGSSRWKIPRKSGKSKKVGPFSWLEFPNGMSCSISVSRSLYQFQVHRRAPRRTGVYDQMEQLFTNRKFHFCSHRNFRVFFPKWKAPSDTVSRVATSRVQFTFVSSPLSQSLEQANERLKWNTIHNYKFRVRFLKSLFKRKYRSLLVEFDLRS